MAVDTVCCEPLSSGNFPLTGKMKGIFALSGSSMVSFRVFTRRFSSIPFSCGLTKQGILSTVSGNYQASNKEFECVTGIRIRSYRLATCRGRPHQACGSDSAIPHPRLPDITPYTEQQPYFRPIATIPAAQCSPDDLAAIYIERDPSDMSGSPA
jgi:hypothetical protein